MRSALEIEVAAKISWTGGPLYTTCCNPVCEKVETTPYEFALCSKCKQSRFCSKECQTSAWVSVVQAASHVQLLRIAQWVLHALRITQFLLTC